MNHISIFGRLTLQTASVMKSYLDTDTNTSFVNKYLDNLDSYFSLSTMLASFPGTWVMIILETVRTNVHVHTNV